MKDTILGYPSWKWNKDVLVKLFEDDLKKAIKKQETDNENKLVWENEADTLSRILSHIDRFTTEELVEAEDYHSYICNL